MLAAGRADVIANPATRHGQYGGYVQMPKEMSAGPLRRQRHGAVGRRVRGSAGLHRDDPLCKHLRIRQVSVGAQACTLTAHFTGGGTGRLESSTLNTLDPPYVTDAQSCANADSGRPSSPSSTHP